MLSLIMFTNLANWGSKYVCMNMYVQTCIVCVQNTCLHVFEITGQFLF